MTNHKNPQSSEGPQGIEYTREDFDQEEHDSLVKDLIQVIQKWDLHQIFAFVKALYHSLKHRRETYMEQMNDEFLSTKDDFEKRMSTTGEELKAIIGFFTNDPDDTNVFDDTPKPNKPDTRYTS